MKTFNALSGKFNLYSKTINTETFELSDLVIYNAEIEGDVADFSSVRQIILDNRRKIRVNENKSYKDTPTINGIEFIATSEKALDIAIEKYKENSIKEIEKAIKDWAFEIKFRENLIKRSIKKLEKINKL